MTLEAASIDEYLKTYYGELTPHPFPPDFIPANNCFLHRCVTPRGTYDVVPHREYVHYCLHTATNTTR